MSGRVEQQYTVPQVAEMLSVGKVEVRNLVRRGCLKAYKLSSGPKGRLRIPHSEIDRFLRAREVPVGRA